MRKKQKLKESSIQTLEQVKLFLEENNIDIYRNNDVERRAYTRKYAKQFSIQSSTAKEHFERYKDYLFMNNDN